MPRIYRTFFNVWVANGWKAGNFEENCRHFGSNEIWTIYNIIRNSSLCGARMPSKRNFTQWDFLRKKYFPECASIPLPLQVWSPFMFIITSLHIFVLNSIKPSLKTPLASWRSSLILEQLNVVVRKLLVSSTHLSVKCQATKLGKNEECIRVALAECKINILLRNRNEKILVYIYIINQATCRWRTFLKVYLWSSFISF